MKESKKEYWILNEKDLRDWIELVLKVNNGYELDEQEMEKLKMGLTILDFNKMPQDIMVLVKNAEKYFEINKINN